VTLLHARVREGHRTSPCVLSFLSSTSAASSCPRSSRASARFSAGATVGSMAMGRDLTIVERVFERSGVSPPGAGTPSTVFDLKRTAVEERCEEVRAKLAIFSVIGAALAAWYAAGADFHRAEERGLREHHALLTRIGERDRD
jgi:hypothetical protein